MNSLIARTSFLLSVSLLIALFISPAFAQQQVKVLRGQAPTIDNETKSKAIDEISKAMSEIYVFPDKAEEMVKLMRKNLDAGNYEKIDDVVMFTEQLTQDLRSVCHDKHLTVVPMMQVPPAVEIEGEEDDGTARLEQLRSRNFGFKKMEILPGNIGYLDLRMFADATLGGATAVAAMNFLANCNAIIFDLRENGGGSPSMIQLITSYFYEEPVHLNSFYIRQTDEIKQFWTQSQVEGPRMVDMPLFVLTSNFTFSGAEEFTYNLKNLERATIIGETTGGGAHPVNFHSFPECKVGVSLPFGRAINPITKTNWEGTGIDPHIAVPAHQALDVALREIYKKTLANEKSENRKAMIEWALMGLEAKLNPVSLAASDLEAFVGTYGPRTIRLREGVLFYQREGRNEFRMKPMARDLFMLEGLEYFRIKFVRDDSGAVVRFTGLYDNGRQDGNDRSQG